MDHEAIKDRLFEYADGLETAETRSLIQSHLKDCRECRDQLDQWKQTSMAYLQPLQAAPSEVFVQEVMRKVRSYAPLSESVRWPLFARWAIPALALSASSFLAVFAYTARPTALSTDALLTEDARPGVSTEWALGAPNADQILELTGEEQ